MHGLSLLAGIFCASTTLLQLTTILLAAHRCRIGKARLHHDGRFTQPVSIVRPVRGLDPYDELTLRSAFELAYPDYELIFCCADAFDPAVDVVNGLIAAYPEVSARLLVGADAATANPKLNNVIKGWNNARFDWIIIADCNVLMPSDYIQRLLAGFAPDTGLLCSPPIGSMPESFCAELECAFLNTYQARWQYAADSAGLGFAQGKTMLWRRDMLDKAGGIRGLGTEIAEDAAATKIVRKQGLRVRLVDGPFEQPLGRRSFKQVWDRQVRWARLRRATFAAFFLPELLTGSLFPMLSGGWAAHQSGHSPLRLLVTLGFLWFGAEGFLARAAGWHLTVRSPLMWILRDLLLPVLWIDAWLENGFNWRGNEMRLTALAKGDGSS